VYSLSSSKALGEVFFPKGTRCYWDWKAGAACPYPDKHGLDKPNLLNHFICVFNVFIGRSLIAKYLPSFWRKCSCWHRFCSLTSAVTSQVRLSLMKKANKQQAPSVTSGGGT